MKDELASRRRGIDGLLKAPEAHAPFLEGVDQVDELLQAPPEPVEPPHHEHVSLPAIAHRRLQLRALLFASRDLLRENPLATGRL